MSVETFGITRLEAAYGYQDNDSFVITSEDGTRRFRVETIRISCHSDEYCTSWLPGWLWSNHKYGGIIIYGVNGQSDWYTANGTHCKSGYLVIQDTDCEPTPQAKFPDEPGIVHGAIYRNVFGESCREKEVIGEGFSIENGEFKVNSRSFNESDDDFHDDNKWMNQGMEKHVRKVVQYWKDAGSNFTRCQNHNIKDLIVRL